MTVMRHPLRLEIFLKMTRVLAQVAIAATIQLLGLLGIAWAFIPPEA